MAEDNGFFKERFFDDLKKHIDRLEEKIDKQNDAIDKINAKINWIWGFGAAAGLFISFIYNYIKSKFFS